MAAELPTPESTGPTDNMVIVLAGGSVRHCADMLAAELAQYPGTRQGGHLFLDFSYVEQLSGAELGTLVTLDRDLRAAGGQLTICNVAGPVYEVFAVSNLHTRLEIQRHPDPTPRPGDCAGK